MPRRNRNAGTHPVDCQSCNGPGQLTCRVCKGTGRTIPTTRAQGNRR